MLILKLLIFLYYGRSTYPLTYPPRNKALWSGLINHWFAFIRACYSILIFEGVTWRGVVRLTSYDYIEKRYRDMFSTLLLLTGSGELSRIFCSTIFPSTSSGLPPRLADPGTRHLWSFTSWPCELLVDKWWENIDGVLGGIVFFVPCWLGFVCLLIFFRFYHGKSPLIKPPIGMCFFLFPSMLCKSKSNFGEGSVHPPKNDEQWTLRELLFFESESTFADRIAVPGAMFQGG